MKNIFSFILSEMGENLRNPVLIEGEDHKILYANKAMREMFGNLVGYNRSILFLSDNMNAMESEGHIFHDEDEPQEVVIADVSFMVTTTPVRDEQNNAYNVVMMEDISEKRGLENKLRDGLRRFNRDAGVARQIQSSIIPADGVYWDTIRLSSEYLPAEVLSGDFFDIVQVSDTKTMVYIADVSGHGIQASLLTMFIRENVRSNLYLAEEGLEKVLSAILEKFIALDIDAMFYLTLLLCCYDKEKGIMSISNAGHNCFPFISRKGGEVEEIAVKGMPITKISDPKTYVEEAIQVSSGDRLILYTDGIVEEYSKILKTSFGSEGMKALLEENRHLPGKALTERIVAEANKYPLISAKDDRTIVVADIL
jgi:sigma-B regulation protein RsbU (phosphoserine phosphatase)